MGGRKSDISRFVVVVIMIKSNKVKRVGWSINQGASIVAGPTLV